MSDPRNFKLLRNKRGFIAWYHRFYEAWTIIIGKWSLHKAWQEGMNYGSAQEYQRCVVRGGR